MKLLSVARASLAALPLLGLAPSLAFAQMDTPAVAPAPPAAGPLRIWVDAQGVPLDTARLQQSLARELGREVVLSADAQAADVAIRMKGEARAEVFYVTPEGEQLSREVDLPPDRERAMLVVSWLTVNLVRDEASELLRQLRARRKAEAEARAAEERAAAEKAAADKAAADKAAVDAARAKAEADAARAKAEKAAAEAAAKPKPEAELLRDPLKSFDVALATPISLLPDSPQRELRLQLALGWGDSGAIRGIGATPSVLRIRRDLNGAAAAAACLLIGRSARGIAVSGGYARVAGKLDGIAVGGGAASAGSMHGALVTGGAGWTSEPSRGLMLSGGVNLAGDLEGIQVAAGVNVARDFRGIAVAPVNVQRKVRGIQFGVINIAEEVDGAAIGIISLARNGRLQPVVWGSALSGDQSVHVALKSIAGYAFTQFGGGISFRGANLSYDAGIGGHIRLSKSLFFEPGAHYSATHKVADASGDPDGQYISYLAMVGLRLGDSVDLLAGGGVQQLLVGGDAAQGSAKPEVRAGIAFF